eukprot:186074-Lingulodinium_polyedra.AAC.1
MQACSYAAPEKLAALDGPRMQAWRIARGLHNAGKEKEQRVSDKAMWLLVGKLPARDVQRVQRLRYLVRLARSGPPQLFALLQMACGLERGWVDLLMQDLDEVRSIAAADHPYRALPDPRFDPYPL